MSELRPGGIQAMDIISIHKVTGIQAVIEYPAATVMFFLPNSSDNNLIKPSPCKAL